MTYVVPPKLILRFWRHSLGLKAVSGLQTRSPGFCVINCPCYRHHLGISGMPHFSSTELYWPSLIQWFNKPLVIFILEFQPSLYSKVRGYSARAAVEVKTVRKSCHRWFIVGDKSNGRILIASSYPCAQNDLSRKIGIALSFRCLSVCKAARARWLETGTRINRYSKVKYELTNWGAVFNLTPCLGYSELYVPVGIYAGLNQ